MSDDVGANKPSYTGPIEEIRPGDVLHWTRFDEYREFMRKKHNIKNIKTWGISETFKDNGMRPFAVPDSTIAKHISEKPEDVTNPFEK